MSMASSRKRSRLSASELSTLSLLKSNSGGPPTSGLETQPTLDETTNSPRGTPDRNSPNRVSLLPRP